MIKSTIKENGHHKIIDKLTVELNDRGGFYEAEFTNLGLKKVPVSDDFVRRFPKLLVGGIWCITDVTYEVVDDPKASPWQIDTLKPIQVARVDYEEFLKARAEFTTEEWMDVLMQSMGFNPDMFGRRAKLLTLIRLVPYCERNYNLLELGPKGTGKSHIYSEFSPHGMLISGSEVTAPKLFVNNVNGRIGLVGYWDCICFLGTRSQPEFSCAQYCDGHRLEDHNRSRSGFFPEIRERDIFNRTSHPGSKTDAGSRNYLSQDLR